MAIGNTFGATALSSYGGFWIGTAIILTPGGFGIEDALTADGPTPFYDSFGFYLMVRQRSSYFSLRTMY
jgi:succinate-acetate transporter protein